MHVAAMAGHTSVSVVLDRYGHLYPQQDDELMQRLASRAGVPLERYVDRIAPDLTTLPVALDELGEATLTNDAARSASQDSFRGG